MTQQTASRGALQRLIALLGEIDERWAGPEWNLHSDDDIAGAHRAMMHILEAGLVGFFEMDATAPDFRRIVTPSRKLTGDNSDAVYFDAPVDPAHSYVVHGGMQGAAYFSLTLEAGAANGEMANRTCGAINDTQLDIDSNGNFTLYLGGEPRERNWLALDADATRVTTRHYFEQPTAAAGDINREPRLRIECLDPPGPRALPTDSSIAAGIDRVSNFVRSRTLGMPPMADREQPAFLAQTPNEFPQPVPPGDFGLAAFDAHYSMAPYFLGEDEALVVTGRWPDCRFANICLWNRFQQTFEYQDRPASLNRSQTVLEHDGSFRLVMAHRDPGVPNWLDTQGVPFGLVFWRFFLVKGRVEQPQAEVVKLADLTGGA